MGTRQYRMREAAIFCTVACVIFFVVTGVVHFLIHTYCNSKYGILHGTW